MADHKKHKNEHKSEQIEVGEEDKWNPTPEAFEAFKTRDAQLALSNIRQVLDGRSISVSLKEIKDSTLHSADTVERVLAAEVAAGSIVESKGRYALPSRVVTP